MAIQIQKLKTFRIGEPSVNWTSEYPELKPNKQTKSLTGEILINTYKCKTWTDFFQKNPMKFPVAKTFYVYEIESDGAIKDTGYVAEGQFQPYKPVSAVLNDDYNSPAADSALRAENTRLRHEVEKLHAQNSDLHELIAERDEQIKELQESEKKWYKEDKLPLERKVLELNYDIKKLEADKETAVQSLRDDYEAIRKKDKDEEEIRQLKANVDSLMNEKKESANSLSGLQSTAAALAPTLLSAGLDALEKAIERRKPGLIENFLNRFSGEPVQDSTAELDPAEAFKTGQGQQ